MSTIDKPQIIDAIRQVNPTARREWLAGFPVPDLRRYLDRLEAATEPRPKRRARARRPSPR